ncbi:unnamed protein product [Rotaria sp. Silwood2]|nr:unnamed protein product [Rotaria sp. Silwood2]CAF4275971.1 unnamed protein product [Rotaria sp. Silwood2]
MPEEFNDLHGMAPDSNDIALLLIDVINHLDFEQNEEAARKADIPIIYVNDNFGKWKSDFHNVIEYVINENKPDFVLKPKHSGFYCTPLDLLLNHLDTETLILAGFAGNICVLLTANDGYMRNYKLIVPSDYIGSNTIKKNYACLEQMKKLLKADTRSSIDIIKEIEKMPKNKKNDEKRAKT